VRSGHPFARAVRETAEFILSVYAQLEYSVIPGPYGLPDPETAVLQRYLRDLMGNETVNGMECIHYQVSGTYDGEYEPMPDTEKYPVTMTVSGDVWVADINAAGPALIRFAVATTQSRRFPGTWAYDDN